MYTLKFLITLIRDPKIGPHLVIALLVISIFWIALMQGINAELWSNDVQLHDPVTTGEVK